MKYSCRCSSTSKILAMFSKQSTYGFTKSITIVRSAPYCGELSIEKDLIAFHTQLVGSINLFHSILMEESFHHVLAKHVAGSSGWQSETCVVCVWVWPHQVSERAFMRYFLNSFDLLDILDMLKGGREPCMDTKDSCINYGWDGEIVKEVCEHLPDVGTPVLSLTFSVETVYLSNLSGLVISS